MTVLFTTVGKTPLEEMKWLSQSTKESKIQYLGAMSKMTEWYWFLDRQTIQHHSNPSLCPNHWGQWRWSWPVLWRPVRPSRTTHTHTQMSFLSLGMECQSRKSRDTWRNRQVWPWSTKWSRTKANRILSRGYTGHNKYPLPTKWNDKMTLHIDITKWSMPQSYWLYTLQPKIEKLCIVSKNKTWSWLWLRSSAPYYKIQA